MALSELISNFNKMDLDSLTGIWEGKTWLGKRIPMGVFRAKREGNIYIYCDRKGYTQH